MMYARLLLEYFGSTVALFSCCAVALIGCLERNGWSSSVFDQSFYDVFCCGRPYSSLKRCYD